MQTKDYLNASHYCIGCIFVIFLRNKSNKYQVKRFKILSLTVRLHQPHVTDNGILSTINLLLTITIPEIF